MKRESLFVFAALGVVTLITVSCYRPDVRTVQLKVPDMHDETSVRIVTNSLLDEIVGRYDGTKHEYEIDIENNTVLYHESRRLVSADYQRQIEACIRQVGYESRVISVKPNPSPIMHTKWGPIQLWPDCHTAVIYVPAMTNNKIRNIVVDAIAYARVGSDDPRISVNRDARSITATFQSRNLAKKNLEHAVTGVGFDVNDLKTSPGGNAFSSGWTPFEM